MSAVHPAYVDKFITDRGYWICANRKTDYCFDHNLTNGLAELFRGKTTFDAGCGNGNYVKHLKRAGIKVVGCDGNPHTTFLADDPDCFAFDLSTPLSGAPFIVLPRQWVLCLEVGEHVPKEFESVFIQNVKDLAIEGIVLSWAVVGQLGHGHVNCMDNDTVRQLFPEWISDFVAERRLRDASVVPHFKNTVMVFRKSV